jgi:menaquinol-cytochrome c reductase cytochrome b/c subunit
VNEEQKQAYYEKYKKAKEKGGKFYPDVIYKDLLVAFAIFILLVGLATFVGISNDPKADPSDSTYIPRPEWYFLFLFEMLKYFPGEIEWVGTIILPGIAIGILFFLPFIDKNPKRHVKTRKISISIMALVVIGMAALTIMAVASTSATEEEEIATTLSDQIVAGEDLYSVHCVECHGPDGEGGEIIGVEGLEGTFVKSISSQDEIYTRSDETFFNIIEYGQPDLAMPPFGRAFGGEFGPGDIDNIVFFMRYTWDDRVELPEQAAQAGVVPVLSDDEIPSYELHVAPIVKRYCVSCHRPGKTNNNYFMQTYEETMESGDHAPNIISGDIKSNLILMLYREEIEAGGAMPPTKALPEELIKIFERWVLGGAPNIIDETKSVSP